MMIEPYYRDDWATIINADCIETMKQMEAESVSAICTDPPYGLEFMGKEWDKLAPDIPQWVRDRMSGADAGHSWQGEAWRERGNYLYHGLEKHKPRLLELQMIWHYAWATEALRVAKPGAHMLVFGGTRTHHRLMCAIEDAGWEIRDCLMYLYGSGFPKSFDVSKAIDKAAGMELESRGHFQFTQADKATTPGAFRTNEERNNPGCRKTAPATEAAKQWDGWGTALKPAWEPIILAMKPLDGTFAENAQKHGVAGLNIDGCWIDGDVHARNVEGGHKGRWPANVIHDGSDEVVGMFPVTESKGHTPKVRGNGGRSCNGHNGQDGVNEKWHDTGAAARFFYTAKASKSERGQGNDHATVKPLALMKYLLTLLSTPTGGLILDPFMGSGTTLLAAKELNMKIIGIEKSEKDCKTAVGRLRQEVLDFRTLSAKPN